MTKNPAQSIRFMVFLLMSSLGLLASGVFLDKLQSPTNYDSRSQALNAINPTVTLTHTPQNPVVGENVTVNLNVNTGSYQTYGLQALNLKLTSTMALALPSALTHTDSSLSTAVNRINNGVIDYLAILANFTTPFNTAGQTKTVAKLTLQPTEPGTISFTFDPTQTIINEYGSGGANLLTNPPSNHSITIAQAPSCVDNDDACDSDSCSYDPDACQATPTPTLTPTPTPTPVIGGTSPTPTPECSEPYAPQKIIARTGLNPGEVNVNWVRPGGQDHFAVSFGREPGKYLWGSSNIGNTRSFTIRFLEPGERYYIAVATVNKCGGVKYSTEVTAVARAAATGARPTPTSQPQVIVDDEEIETTPTPATSATPVPATTPDLNQPSTANQTLLDRLKSGPALVVIIIALLIFLASKLIGRKPPRPPSTTQHTSSTLKSPYQLPDIPKNHFSQDNSSDWE